MFKFSRSVLQRSRVDVPQVDVIARQLHTRLSPRRIPRKDSHKPFQPRPQRKNAISPLKTLCWTRRYSSPSVLHQNFTYGVAAAYSGKSNTFDRKRHYQDLEAPSTDEHTPAQRNVGMLRVPSGQDAYFIGNVGKTQSVAFGIADGVGGYADQGIDSAAFAHGLCAYMGKAAHNFPDGFKGKPDTLSPLSLLKRGYSNVCADKSISGGGSTACLAVAGPEGILDVANLGDSGFIQLRLNAVHYYSNPQTHAFNTPFQLSRLPPKILAQIEDFGGSAPFSDMPADASLSSHQLRHADVLVFATDGVWDNLTSQEILDQVSSSMIRTRAWLTPDFCGVQVSEKLPELTTSRLPTKTENGSQSLQAILATDITAKAKAASVNPKRDGPFAKAVQQAYPGERFAGGKVDDICVVVAIALDESMPKL
ncbi:MAG: hypothetical protein M1828_006287 [Chrysothrix sp. TS-e1954]|nr:MAG: hypothetical protein M1828_006287 [Chrysothrix sp. TS-e1954]